MSLRQDLVYAVREFRRAPMFATAAVLTVALGVGACTAVFSVVDRILFRSLPYHGGERLVCFGMAAPIVPQEFMLGYDYLDWRDAGGPFESLWSWTGVGDCDLSGANPVPLRCACADSGRLVGSLCNLPNEPLRMRTGGVLTVSLAAAWAPARRAACVDPMHALRQE